MLDLNETNATRYLLQRNRIASLQDVRFASLGGGVSNTVLLIETPSERFVLKQSLPKLRVQDDWFADQTRIFRAAECIRAMSSVLGHQESFPTCCLKIVSSSSSRSALRRPPPSFIKTCSSAAALRLNLPRVRAKS